MTQHIVLAQAFGGDGLKGMLPMLLGMFAIMYFVMIRPQQKQMKEHKDLLANLKKGDDVVTTGGLIGKVFSVAERELTLEVSGGVKVRVLKTAVQSLFTVPSVSAEDTSIKKEEK